VTPFNVYPSLRKALVQRLDPMHKEILQVAVRAGVPKDTIMKVASLTVGIESVDYWMVRAFLEECQ